MENWPDHIQLIASLRESEDKGVGDTIERLAKLYGGSHAAALYKRIWGKDCGCKSRRDKANELYPYQAT